MTSALRIGLQVGSVDPYWVEVRETIWRLCRPSSLNAGVFRNHAEMAAQLPEIELIEVDLPGLHAPDDAATRVEELLALELDALIGVPDSAATIQGLLVRGLPVVSLIHRDIDHPFFTSPRELSESAHIACRHLADICAHRGRMLIVGGRYVAGAPELTSSRVLAALEVFGAHAEIEWRHIHAPWDYDGARAALLDTAAVLDGPFAGVFGLSDTLALVARELGASLGLLTEGSHIVGINGDPLAIMAIAQGSLCATVATSAGSIAHKAVELACSAAVGDPLPRTFSYAPELVTKANVGEIALTKLAAIADMPSRLVGVNRRAEEHRLTQLETGIAINRSLGSMLERDVLTHEIAELIRTNYGYDHVQIFLWDPESRTLVLDHPCGDAEVATSTATAHPNSLRVDLSNSAALGHALLRNRPVFIPDTRRSHRFAPDPRWPATHSRVIVPIRYGAKTLGLLDLHSCELNTHTQVELDGLQALADQLGVAIRNAQLYADALKARAEAEQASHLKTRLLANVSHELRMPLNVILGYSQTALSEPNPYGVSLPDELRADLVHIRNSGEHLVRLVNDIIDQSQAEIGALEIFPEQVDLAALLTDVYEHLPETVLIERGVACRLELARSLPTMTADPLRLRQIVLNLVSNAAKFTSQGHITLGAVVQRDWVHIWVEDTGTGISKSVQERMFDPFVTTAAGSGAPGRSRVGVGLGLSVAHQLAVLHRGRLQIESKPGCGTIGHLYLPLLVMDEGMNTPVMSTNAGLMPLDPLLNGILDHSSEVVKRAALLLRDQYATAVSSQDIGDTLGMSPDYLGRLFRRETGMTPRQYLNRYRILQAQKLLIAGNASVTDIATQVGFSEAAYFSRVFRKEVGQSPLSFRKNTN